MAEKLSPAEQNRLRSILYNVVREALEGAGYTTETFIKGTLIHLEDGQFAKLGISIADPEKFDLAETRATYAAQQAAAAERAEKAVEKAQKVAAKQAAKAAAAAEKAQAE